MRKEFTADVSHELKTPIGKIIRNVLGYDGKDKLSKAAAKKAGLLDDMTEKQAADTAHTAADPPIGCLEPNCRPPKSNSFPDTDSVPGRSHPAPVQPGPVPKQRHSKRTPPETANAEGTGNVLPGSAFSTSNRLTSVHPMPPVRVL